jgi:hypothetical protein
VLPHLPEDANASRVPPQHLQCPCSSGASCWGLHHSHTCRHTPSSGCFGRMSAPTPLCIRISAPWGVCCISKVLALSPSTLMFSRSTSSNAVALRQTGTEVFLSIHRSHTHAPVRYIHSPVLATRHQVAKHHCVLHARQRVECRRHKLAPAHLLKPGCNHLSAIGGLPAHPCAIMVHAIRQPQLPSSQGPCHIRASAVLTTCGWLGLQTAGRTSKAPVYIHTYMFQCAGPCEADLALPAACIDQSSTHL